MGQIGEELRTHREIRGLSLRDVEEATKIRMKYLIALEADDFDALPGKVYVVGFLRTYARFLGINDEDLVNSLKSLSHFDVHEEVVVKRRKKSAPQKPKSILLIVIIVIALLASGMIYALSRDQEGTKIPNESIPQNQTPQEEEETPSNIPTVPEAESPTDQNSNPGINGISVTVIVKESNCWLDVSIDGETNYQGTLNGGENRTFVGQDKIIIKYGNAGVVEVIANGESVYPLGNIGQVVTKEYSEN